MLNIPEPDMNPPENTEFYEEDCEPEYEELVSGSYIIALANFLKL